MKKIIIVSCIVFSIVCLFFLWRIHLRVIELNCYYLNIRVLNEWKNTTTNVKRKDGAYNFVYAFSSESIIRSRNDVLGKIASDWLEKKYERFKPLRIEAEKYMTTNRIDYVVNPDGIKNPKVNVLID